MNLEARSAPVHHALNSIPDVVFQKRRLACFLRNTNPLRINIHLVSGRPVQPPVSAAPRAASTCHAHGTPGISHSATRDDRTLGRSVLSLDLDGVELIRSAGGPNARSTGGWTEQMLRRACRRAASRAAREQFGQLLSGPFWTSQRAV